jgi:hypothetical protein
VSPGLGELGIFVSISMTKKFYYKSRMNNEQF